MAFLERAHLILVLTACLVVSVNGQSPSPSERVETVRVDGGYRVRYLDPDFDNKPMELFVRDATRLNVNIATTIREERGLGWRYEFEILNLGDSDQSIVQWAMQVQGGTQILISPTGWQTAISSDGLSMLTASATRGYEVAPGLSATGFSLLSDSLPEVRQGNVRGSAQLDLDSADLPAHVRRYLSNLEQGNNVRLNVIGPWIATRQIARGHEGPIDPRAILRRAADSYAEPLQAIAASEGRVGVERVTQILEQLATAQVALAAKNKIGAADSLRQAVRLLGEGRSEPWSRAVRGALTLVLEYVRNEIK